MTLDGCGKPQVIADGLTLLITDGLPMRRPAVHESGSGKSSAQPDGGEGLAKCKGYRREAVSEGSIEQTRESMDKNRIQGASVGRAGNVPRSPYPSKMRSVDSATVRGRRLRLPRGILTAGQKSGEGVLGYVVGKASEALHAERRRQQIGRAGNGD